MTMMWRIVAVVVLAQVAAPAVAQESPFAADLRRERARVAESCGEFSAKAVGGCVYTLATDSPFHVALGSIAPQNGFALGLAFVEHYTPNESWRISWNADAVATPSGSWRSGAFMKLVHTPATSGVVVRQPGAGTRANAILPRELAVIDVLTQTLSLQSVNYFGLGQQSVQGDRSVFGERQTMVGASATYPLGRLRAISALRPALQGGITGRFVDIRSAKSDQAPSIDQRYDDATAPGLSHQTAFVEFREGIRLRPSAANGWLHFNYLLSAQQFRTDRAARSSFRRWTVDLQHEIPLYRHVSSTGPNDVNGPNECAQGLGASACPPVQRSRNRQGSIGFRLLATASSTSDGDRVPFYFQPTLGGSDINGDRRLASYQDYRFRGPNVLMLQESAEHSIWGPFGVYVLAEQGKVASTRGGLNLSDLAGSATVGVTLRAGGFPMVNLSFSWGSEGHHVIGSMNSSLLGGSSRPSVY